MVVEKQQILYGSDVAAPTTLQDTKRRVVHSVFVETAESPNVWAIFVI